MKDPGEFNHDGEQQTKQILELMDQWISKNRKDKKFPGNGSEGQRYLAGLISGALLRTKERTEQDPFYGIRYNGCLTGDCPHQLSAECDAHLAAAVWSADRKDRSKPEGEK